MSITFVFGARSRGFLAHVDPRMVAVAELALSLSPQDFGFTEPQARTEVEEMALVAAGHSHTLHSHHIIDCRPGWAAPGFCGAVDAVAWDGKAYVWEWQRQYVIAAAFAEASHQLQTPITWGGCWDRLMSELGSTPQDMAAAVVAYQAREMALGNRHPLIDGPHFELGAN